MIRLLFCRKSNIVSNLKPPSLNNASIIHKKNASSKINKPNPEVFRPSGKSKQENKENHKITTLGWFLIVSIVFTSEIIVIYQIDFNLS